MSADAAIASLASTPAGNVTFAQLREHGLSEKAIRTRAARGSLARRFRGVHAVGHAPQQWFSLAFAAWLACGRASALSGTASAAALGVLPEPAGPVHLTRPTAGAPQPGLVLHQGGSRGVSGRGHPTRRRAWVTATTSGALSLRGDRRAA